MASVRSPRRQLAPTVGHEVALAGVHIRAGILDINGERTVSALVQRIYNMDFINDNAGCFANGGKFPQNGRTIEFGRSASTSAPSLVRRRSPVLVAPDPPRWMCAGRAAGSVEVMMAGAVNTGKGAVEEGDEPMHTLATPIAQNIDPAKAQEELEATRKALLTGGADIIRAQRELNLTLHQDLRKEVLTGKSASVSVSIVEKPKYSSPDKTIKAAKAAVELCESLSGDELAKQQERVKELLKTIEQQNAEQLAKLNEAWPQNPRSTKNAGSKSQASSPHPDKRREREKNARQMTVYDPVLAGKQKAGQNDAGRKSQGADRGYAKGGYAGNNHAGKYETGQNYRAARVAYVDEEMPPPGYRQARAAEPEEYDESDSEQYRDNRNNKRREDFPDRRYASQQVAAVQENYDASGSQRQKTGSQPWAGPKKQWVEKKPWGQKKNWQEPVKYTMEAAMDQPCRWHTPNPDHPSNHLTKDCSWTKFLMQKGAVKDAQAPGGPVQQQQQLPPPPPLTGANALPVQPQPNRQQYQQVNRVEQNNDQPPPPAPLGRNVYEDPHLCMVVFVTEPMDRQSVHRRSMEVNAVMPAVPKYMLWSDQEITWSFKDHPKIMPNPGGYALVVDPIMKGPETRVKFSKVLIDNGSSINIMYKHTMPTNRVVSVVVVVEREEEGKTVQRPVYYLSEVLSSSKQNYPHFQKMTYGVFMAATKLKHYFEEHPMKVVSEAPISDIMGNKDASGRIAKWAIQLSPYVPVYERRDAIKSQALADFLVDWAEIQYKPPEHKIEYWKMHFDGSKLKEGLGAGVVLTSPKGDHLRYVLQVHFRASNNVASTKLDTWA
ncbi:hypothetical protein QYE76_042851 [Lolium multiflorum]|uniref:Reverse transcriptase RNase H-like domain-containing protein n=1 Tax=Lolium multiflorum TaxID=4521 RepID=A0AAD8THL8_LOLMU|nr:hypothetical protein QYE76_042851 [Lolium multiflorum]